MDHTEIHDVIVIGGGPVGLFLGLNLARQGIETLVLEAESDIIPSPRALMCVRFPRNHGV
jgi:2-polyprenyl-6-methoxyphenol hydroxylase-like FAD-dependent oxidoreductase